MQYGNRGQKFRRRYRCRKQAPYPRRKEKRLLSYSRIARHHQLCDDALYRDTNAFKVKRSLRRRNRTLEIRQMALRKTAYRHYEGRDMVFGAFGGGVRRRSFRVPAAVSYRITFQSSRAQRAFGQRARRRIQRYRRVDKACHLRGVRRDMFLRARRETRVHVSRGRTQDDKRL